MKFSIRHRSETVTIAVSNQLVVPCWHGPPTDEAIDALESIMDERFEREGRFVLCAIIDNTAFRKVADLPLSLRERFIKTTELAETKSNLGVVVIKGEGFVAASLRMIIASTFLVARVTKMKIKVAPTFDEAAGYIAPIINEQTSNVIAALDQSGAQLAPLKPTANAPM